MTPDDGSLTEFSTVVGQIYDAAVDPDAWPAALEAVRGFVGTRTAAMISYDVFDRAPPWQFHVGYEDHWLQLYGEKYYALNPYMDFVAKLGSGETHCSSSQADYPQLFESEFYLGWLKPQGLLDGSALVVEKSMNHITTLISVRDESQGVFDDAAVARLELLYPHLRRAVLISRAFESHRKRLADDTALLDALAAGMFLLNARGEIIQANAAGEALLADRSPLTSKRGRLELAVAAADQALNAALAAGGEGELELGGRGASIPVRSADGAELEYMLHLLPLNAARQHAIDAAKDAAFVLFIRRLDRADFAALAAFTEQFQLTPKEADVLRTVVEVGGVPQAADVLGLSGATVRTHVTAIFDKSGVRRQADLIRLLMEMKSPFVV